MIKPNLKQKIKNTVNANRIIAMKYVENALKSTEIKTPKKVQSQENQKMNF